MSHELISLVVALALPLWLVAEQVVAWKLFAREAAPRPSRGRLHVTHAAAAPNGSPDNSTGSVIQHQAA